MTHSKRENDFNISEQAWEQQAREMLPHMHDNYLIPLQHNLSEYYAVGGIPCGAVQPGRITLGTPAACLPWHPALKLVTKSPILCQAGLRVPL